MGEYHRADCTTQHSKKKKRPWASRAGLRSFSVRAILKWRPWPPPQQHGTPTGPRPLCHSLPARCSWAKDLHPLGCCFHSHRGSDTVKWSTQEKTSSSPWHITLGWICILYPGMVNDSCRTRILFFPPDSAVSLLFPPDCSVFTKSSLSALQNILKHSSKHPQPGYKIPQGAWLKSYT